MDPNIVTIIKVAATVAGAIVTNLTLIYRIIKSFEGRIEKHLAAQDERIFQLATGKSLREAMLEAKKKAEGQ